MTYIHPRDDRYGRKVGGHRYKKWVPPEPLSVTILKLTALGVAFTAASIFSPTFLLSAIKAYLKYKYDEAQYYDYLEKQRIKRSLRYLRRRHFIAFPAMGKKGKFAVTRAGRIRLSEIELAEIAIRRVPWDGRWRLVTFDVPEEKSGQRHLIRKKLKRLGFFHLQRSVFLFPFPCEKEVGKIKEILDIETNVHLLTADRFSGDEELVKHYNLGPRPKFVNTANTNNLNRTQKARS